MDFKTIELVLDLSEWLIPWCKHMLGYVGPAARNDEMETDYWHTISHVRDEVGHNWQKNAYW